MADSTETAPEASQLTFKVKSTGDKVHTITMADTATVLELKTKLAGDDFENVPVERQRLIYSGRVMKNDDALSVYKIKHLNTIHMVKSAASNPTPAPAASTPTPQAVPQNMAAGASANNLLAGLTGARFAGHANLPSRDLFGADGGMGAPPTEEEIAQMLSNPAIAQTMNEALSNPAFIDHMIQTNPMLARMPNAREMLQSPYFRSMMTNPEALRTAAQMRRLFGGGGGVSGFPAPGATDTTPATEGSSASGNNTTPPSPFLDPAGLMGLFGPPPAGGTNPADNPLAALLGGFGGLGVPPAATGASGAPTTQTGASSAPGTRNTSAGTGATAQTSAGNAQQQPANPFLSLFGSQSPIGASTSNPFGPSLTPEAFQQMMQMLGLGGASPASPADNRPPEERYAEQLRQLNDMGFFDFERNIAALRRSGGSVQGAIEHLLNGS